MENNAPSEPNPFKNIERIIIAVLVVWVLAIFGWFVNNKQIPADQKVVESANIFLEKNDISAEVVNCLVDNSKEFGTCTATTKDAKTLTIQCPVTSMFSDFASVFFAKGQPCEFLDPIE